MMVKISITKLCHKCTLNTVALYRKTVEIYLYIIMTFRRLPELSSVFSTTESLHIFSFCQNVCNAQKERLLIRLSIYAFLISIEMSNRSKLICPSIHLWVLYHLAVEKRKVAIEQKVENS